MDFLTLPHLLGLGVDEMVTGRSNGSVSELAEEKGNIFRKMNELLKREVKRKKEIL